jgi:hypothetical protein
MKAVKSTCKKEEEEVLEPPDPKQCQALIPNGNSFMTFGGKVGHERCTAKPWVIITERTPPKGFMVCGSMSLCSACWLKAIDQLGQDAFTVSPVKEQEGLK